MRANCYYGANKDVILDAEKNIIVEEDENKLVPLTGNSK